MSTKPIVDSAFARLGASLVRVDWLKSQLPNSEDQREYARQRVIVAVTDAIAEQMEIAGVRRAEIAARLGQSKGRISHVLSGRRNMTLRTLGDILWALDLELEDLRLAPLGSVSCPVQNALEWYNNLGHIGAQATATAAFEVVSGPRPTVQAEIERTCAGATFEPPAAADQKAEEQALGQDPNLALAA